MKKVLKKPVIKEKCMNHVLDDEIMNDDEYECLAAKKKYNFLVGLLFVLPRVINCECVPLEHG